MATCVLVSFYSHKIAVIVKPKCIQTPSTFLILSQLIRYSLENGNTICQELKS